MYIAVCIYDCSEWFYVGKKDFILEFDENWNLHAFALELF